MKNTLCATLVMIITCLSCMGEMRTLVSSDGKSMKAELLSHDGTKVKIRREDGKEFELDPSIFCKQDHESILAWMKANPPKIDYRLRGGATRKNEKVSDYTTNSHYELTLRNDGQEAVKDITILYRILYEKYGSERMEEGEHKLEQNLEFNRTLVLRSEKISFSRSSSYRNTGMRGCLIRVLDPKGEVIMDWVSNDVGMKGVNWESTNPKDPNEPGQKVEIR